MGTSLLEQATTDAWAAMKAVADSVRARFSRGAGADATRALAEVEEAPADDARRQALAKAIEDEIGRSPHFQAELSRLVDEARRDPSVNSFVTNITGDVKQQTNIGQAGDITFT